MKLMQKKFSLFLLFFLIFVSIIPMVVSADTGPKASVVVDFVGLQGKNYYVTLLSERDTTGPYSALSAYHSEPRLKVGEKDYDIYQKFTEYKDTDGYYFLQYFENCTYSKQLSWSYFPPSKFKILIYFPQENRFVCSKESYERYAFDSYYKVNMGNADIMTVSNIVAEKNYNYSKEILSFIARLILTIAIELLIALLFAFRAKKQILLIVCVNIVTQIFLNVALSINIYTFGPRMYNMSQFYLLELIVFAVEAVVYSIFLKKFSNVSFPNSKPAVYALVANMASFVLGLVIANWIPNIF